MAKKPIHPFDPDQVDRLFSLGTDKDIDATDAQADDSPPSSDAPRDEIQLGQENKRHLDAYLAHQRTAPQPLIEQAGQSIGRYKLLERIGEGGFGTVFAAQQQSPVKRRVALKIIKPGMDSRQVIGRFEAERQALALMDHPNIAKVLDAGATESGRPYFVMELVKGVPITQYCDQEKLNTRERLYLFTSVCHAIQHAHQKGIIHRDIKPSNILTTLHDGRPAPKVIDFGIAKATQQELTDKTVYTHFQQFIGTPAYMSPEQAEMSGLDIDTRSDIYSLGVLLYELLTGTTPFDTQELIKSGPDGMRQIIRERDPVKPSTRLTQEQARATTEHRTPNTEIATDLDWIVLKCLEKDRTRRYDTANGLAMDIQRHLVDEPVIACPPSTLYKFQKAWRRNRVVYAAAAMVAFALVIGMVVSAWQAWIAKKARVSAELSEYVVRMTLLQSDWDRSNMARAWDSLEKSGTYPGRGLEWYIWQQQLHQDIRKMQIHEDRVGDLVFSPDGRSFATVSNDSTVKLWETDSWKLIRQFKGHSGWVREAAFSPDGRWLLTGAAEALTARIWDVTTGRTIVAMQGLNQITSVAWSNDGARLATGGMANEVYIWDVSDVDFNRLTQQAADGTPTEIWTLESPYLYDTLPYGRTIWDVEFSANGEHLLVGGDGSILRMWDLTASQPSYRDLVGHSQTIWSVAFSANEEWIISGAEETIVWDAHTGNRIDTFAGHSRTISHAEFSQDGNHILTGSWDGTARWWEWNGTKATEIHALKGHRASCWVARFLPDNSQQVVTTGNDGALKLWDLATIRPLRLQHDQEVMAVAFLTDGHRLLTGDAKGVVRLWNQEARRIEKTLPVNKDGLEAQSIRFMVLSPDNEWFVAVADMASTVSVWNLASGRRRYPPLEHTEIVHAVAISPDGRWIATGADDGLAHVWHADSGQKYAAFRGNKDVRLPPLFSVSNWPLQGVVSVAFAANGQLWVGRRSGAVSIWDLDKQARIGELSEALSVHTIKISPDGSRVATVPLRTPASVWNVSNGEWLFDLVGHSGNIDHFSFVPNGSRILTVSWERTTKLWETVTGQEVLSLPGRHAALSSDGQQIATAIGNLVHVWTAASQAQVDHWQQEKAEWAQRFKELRGVP